MTPIRYRYRQAGGFGDYFSSEGLEFDSAGDLYLTSFDGSRSDTLVKNTDLIDRYVERLKLTAAWMARRKLQRDIRS